MSVAAVNNTSSTASASALGATSQSASQISNQFLTMLITQLKNQDPMNPMDNAQITTQLAQLSTVQGVSDLNTTLSGLKSQFQATQALQGAALIGHSVLAQGGVFSLGSAGAGGGFDLASSADQVQVSIQNSAGTTVRTLNLGQAPAGLTQFAWDGKDTTGNALAQGNYSFKVSATAAGKTVNATAYALDQVQSVSMTSTGINADLANLGSQGLDKIKQIF
jgi:flagellar basal-body rod modification protein FlgD